MRRTLFAASLLTVVAAAARAQEPILLRISGQAGQFNRYQTVMETFIRGGQMAAMMSPDTTLPFSRMRMFSTRTLMGTSGDTLNFQEVVDSASMETPAMPQMAPMMAGAAAQLRGRTTATKMDSRGRVFSTEVTGGMAMGGPGGGGPGGRGGRGGMGGGRNNATPFILPAQAVRPGDTWSDSTTVTGNGTDQPTVAVQGNFKLDRVDQHPGSRVAVITWTGTMTTTTPQGSQVMNVVGEIDVDMTAHRLAAMNMTMTGTVQSPQGEIPMKIQMSQTLM
jgi:hypothetical protein